MVANLKFSYKKVITNTTINLLNKLTKKSDVDADEEKLSPSDGWVIHRDGKEIIQIDRLDAPLV